MNALNFAVVGAHNRGRISVLAHRPEEGLRLVAACATHLEGLEVYLIASCSKKGLRTLM